MAVIRKRFVIVRRAEWPYLWRSTNTRSAVSDSRLSLRAQTIPPSGIRRFFEIAATMDHVISLGIGEPDFVTPQPAIDAAIGSLKAGRTGYTANAGLGELRDVISADIKQRYGVSYDPGSQIMVTVGASEAILLAMLATISPGDEVLIPEPCFVSYAPAVQMAGGTVVYVPTSVENDFQVTAADIAERITPKTKMLFLGYPNNPTGAVLRRDTLEEIAQVVVKHDLIVLSDEIYDRLVYGHAYVDGHTCLPSIPSLYDRTILISGFSKNYAMTGWRIGYACAPPDIYRAMYVMHQYVVMSSPTMGQVAAHAAMRDCQDQVEAMRQAYDIRRRTLVDGLRAAGLPTFEPEGAFYAFPDVRSTGLDPETFVTNLLNQDKVACVPGDAFGPSGSGYIRCSYANSLENIQEAVRRITAFADRARESSGKVS